MFRSKKEFGFMSDVVLGTFLIDLGTIIAGTSQEKTINIRNIGKQPVSF